MIPTFLPNLESARAILTDVVDLPTPPLPDATAIIEDTPLDLMRRSSSVRSSLGFGLSLTFVASRSSVNTAVAFIMPGILPASFSHSLRTSSIMGARSCVVSTMI